MAGVHLFSPPGFPDQEPGSDQRESLMMMPASPIPHFVVGQPRLALAPPNAFLDSMLRLRHAGQLFQWRRRIRIRQIVVVLHLAIFPHRTRDHQEFLRRVPAAALGPGHHRGLGDLHDQRSFLAVTHLHFGPCLFRQGSGPAIHTLEGRLRARPSPAVCRRRPRQVADVGVRRHGQKIRLSRGAQLPAKPRRTAHFVVAGDPRVRQKIALLGEHLQRQLVSRAKANLFRYAADLPSGLVLGPLLWEIQAHVYQGMLLRRGVARDTGARLPGHAPAPRRSPCRRPLGSSPLSPDAPTIAAPPRPSCCLSSGRPRGRRRSHRPGSRALCRPGWPVPSSAGDDPTPRSR